MELRNRLVMSPMETAFGTKDGLPSPRTLAYFEARARGGVGLITLGACTIDSAAQGSADHAAFRKRRRDRRASPARRPRARARRPDPAPAGAPGSRQPLSPPLRYGVAGPLGDPPLPDGDALPRARGRGDPRDRGAVPRRGSARARSRLRRARAPRRARLHAARVLPHPLAQPTHRYVYWKHARRAAAPRPRGDPRDQAGGGSGVPADPAHLGLRARRLAGARSRRRSGWRPSWRRPASTPST